MKQDPHWGPTNIKRHRTQNTVAQATWRQGFLHS